MKLIRAAGATSEIWQIFILDSSSTTGAGLTGLTNASAGLTAYFHRDVDTTATVISLVTMTVGTFTSAGFKEIDATNMPGWYQFCPPNTALAAGAKSCAFHLKGATNMAPLPIEVDLAANVIVGTNNDKTGYSLTQVFPTNFSAMAITAGGAVTVGTNNDKTGYSLTQVFPTNFSALGISVGGAISTVTTLTTYTGNTPQTGDCFARLGVPAGASVSVDIAALPTAASNADKVLGRSIAGGADGGSTVTDALRILRNRWFVSAGVLHVRNEGDTADAWTRTVTTNAAAAPITGTP